MNDSPKQRKLSVNFRKNAPMSTFFRERPFVTKKAVVAGSIICYNENDIMEVMSF
jgi:hypothetical protein